MAFQSLQVLALPGNQEESLVIIKEAKQKKRKKEVSASL